MAQLMPLALTISCFSKIQIGLIFLVPAHPGSPGKKAVKWVYVYVCLSVFINFFCFLMHMSAVLLELGLLVEKVR